MNIKRFFLGMLTIIMISCFVFAGCSAGNSANSDDASNGAPHNAGGKEELSLPLRENETTVNTEPATTAPEETVTETEVPVNSDGSGSSGSGSSGSSGSGGVPSTPGVTNKERCTITVGSKGYVVDKGDTITYTYKLKAPKKIQDVQATLSYDNTYLKLKSTDDAESIFPVLGVSTIYNTSLDNMIKFNAVKIAGYDFTAESTLITLEFEVLKNGGTAISTDIEIMTAVDGTVYADNSVLTDGIVCKETITE